MRGIFWVGVLELGVEDAPRLPSAVHLYHLGYMLVFTVGTVLGVSLLQADILL